MKIKRLISSVMSLFVGISTMLGGGLINSQPSAVFAEENNGESTLETGTYTASLIRQKSYDDSAINQTSALHLNARAILNVDDSGNTRVTVGVQNWSLYDAFIPVSSNYVNQEITSLPANVFNSENSSYFTNFTVDSNEISEEVDGYFLSKDNSNTKFGDIQIEYAEDVDVAYVTFDIDNSAKKIAIQAWTNKPVDLNNECYNELMYFYFDDGTITNVDEIVNDANLSNWSYYLLHAGAYNTMSFTTRVNVNYKGTKKAYSVFDSVAFSKNSSGNYVASYHINEAYEYSNFRTLSTVSHKNTLESESDHWDLHMTALFNSIEVTDDGCINIEYDSLNELLTGQYVFFDIGTKEYFVSASVAPSPIEILSISDASSGITVATDTSKLNTDAQLSVIINDDNLQNKYNRMYYDKWHSELLNNTQTYTLHLLDGNGNTLETNVAMDSVTIPIPIEINVDNMYFEIMCVEGNSGGSIGSINYSPGIKYNIDAENRKLVFYDQKINDVTFVLAEHGNNTSTEKVYTLTNDGIYSANAYLIHRNQPGDNSMADEIFSLNRKVYIVVKSNQKYMYFNAGTARDTYIGEIFCDKGTSSDGEVYDESILYTKYAVDENGDLLENCGYDPITEWACVKGGILNLMNECYLENYDAYSIAVIPPAMNFGQAYGAYKKDDTCAWLEFTDLKQCGDEVTMQTIIDEGYGYQPSALLRKIKQAEIKYNIGKNTVSNSTAFADAYAVYNKENATSQEIEAAINALDAVTTDAVPSAKVTGYSLTAKEDFGLHLFADLGYDAQNDANAAIKFTIGDKEQTIAVSDATFVEGKGYEFTLDVPAKAMFDEITAEVVLSDGAEAIGDTNLGTYSVAGYLNDYIATDDDTFEALAQATLNYGAYAAQYFRGSTDADLADVSAVTIDDVAPYKHNIEIAEEGIDFVGAALTLESKTSVKLYFKVDEDNLYDITDFAFTVNGNKAEPERNGDYYYITVPKLTAGELAKAQTFTVKGEEYSYSPFSYVYAALADSDAEKEADLINLVKALYLYGVEAGKVA